MSVWGYRNSLGDPRLTVALLTSTNLEARAVARRAFFGDLAGTAAWTLGGLTLTGTGTVGSGGGVSGTGALQLGALTLTGAGTVPMTGTGALALGALTLTGAGTVPVTGTGALSLGALTLTGAGRVAVAGTGALSLGAITLTGSGTVPVAGTGALALGALTLSGSGSVSSGVTGTGTLSLGAITLTGAGTVPMSGTGTLSLGAITIAGAGTVAVAGTGALNLGAITLTGAGRVAVAGTGALSLGAINLTGTGTVPMRGTGAWALGSIQFTGAGSVGAYGWLSPSSLRIFEAVTTVDAIRDRIIAVIHALVPTSLVRDRFRVYRDEAEDFIAWAQATKAGALRRFQVVDTFDDAGAATSDTLVEERVATFEILVAYPQTARAGSEAGRDRVRMMREDQQQLENAVGLRGYGNFAGEYPNASWTEGTAAREVRDGVDVLVIRQTMRFYALA